MKEVKTRKHHYCEYCNKGIPKGSKAKTTIRRFTRVNGIGAYFETYYFHLNCPIKYNDQLF